MKTVEAKSGVYAIVNNINGTVYIGSAKNIKHRWRVHFWALYAEKHHSIRLQRAWAKHGESAFSFRILEEVRDENLLIKAEQQWIDKFNAYGPKGYNMVPVAGTNLGMIHSDKTKGIIAAKARGRIVSDETKAKMSASSPRLKRFWTEEQKRRISIALTGRKGTKSSRAKQAASSKGRIKSPETLAKMSASMKGKNRGKHSVEHCKKISESMKGNHFALGYKHTEETRKKVSAAIKGRVYSIERNAKISLKLKGRKQSPEHIAHHAAAVASYRPSEEVKKRISATLLLLYTKRREIAKGEELRRCAS